MEKSDAVVLTDEVLRYVQDQETERALRPMLVEALKMIEGCDAFVVRKEEDGAISTFLLSGESLLWLHARSSPPMLSVRCLDLADVVISRGCEKAEGGAPVWTTTWLLEAAPEHIKLLGRFDLTDADNTERFGWAVARAAGWPVVSKESPAD